MGGGEHHLVESNSNTLRGGKDGGESDGKKNDALSFPPGYRFHPYDEELIIHYLAKKVMNRPLPENNIKDVNLYQYNPEQLIEKYKLCGEKIWYFFTPRDRKYRNGTRPNRAAGDGYWKATGADRPIMSNNKLVGYRKALVFYRGKPTKSSSIKTNWIMHEFRVPEDTEKLLPRLDGSMRLDDWVLCRIHWKPEKAERPLKTRRRDDGQAANLDPPGFDDDIFDNEIEAIGGGDYDNGELKQNAFLNCPMGIFNTTTDFGDWNYPEFSQYTNEQLGSLECLNGMGSEPYNNYLNMEPMVYPLPNSMVGKFLKPNDFQRGIEEYSMPMPENYDLPSQIDLYNKSVQDSPHLLETEDVMGQFPKTDAPYITPAKRPSAHLKRNP